MAGERAGGLAQLIKGVAQFLGDQVPLLVTTIIPGIPLKEVVSLFAFHDCIRSL